MIYPVEEYNFSLVVRILVTSYLSLVISVGMIGNCLVCVVYGLTKELHTPINMLIINLALADILQSLNMIFMILSVNYGKWIFGSTMCQIDGFVTISFVLTSIFSLFLISINRYIKVCHPARKDIFSRKVAIYVVLCSWLLPAMIAAGPLIGWSTYSYSAGKILCTLKSNEDFSYTITLCVASLFIPFGGICFCYFNIIITIRQRRKKIMKQHTTIFGRKRESHITTMLGIVIGSFLLFYLPSATMNIYEIIQSPNHKLPKSIDLFGVLLAMLNHANNPIIYGYMNKNFRKPIKKLLRIKPRREEIEEQTKFTDNSELHISSRVLSRCRMTARNAHADVNLKGITLTHYEFVGTLNRK